MEQPENGTMRARKKKKKEAQDTGRLESILPQGLEGHQVLLFQSILQILKQFLCSPSSRKPSNGLQVA
jgi:hypothetical protein